MRRTLILLALLGTTAAACHATESTGPSPTEVQRARRIPAGGTGQGTGGVENGGAGGAAGGVRTGGVGGVQTGGAAGSVQTGGAGGAAGGVENGGAGGATGGLEIGGDGGAAGAASCPPSVPFGACTAEGLTCDYAFALDCPPGCSGGDLQIRSCVDGEWEDVMHTAGAPECYCPEGSAGTGSSAGSAAAGETGNPGGSAGHAGQDGR